MSDRTDTVLFRDLVESGIRNLSVYRDHVNELNVFPVPDGDTGTNMVLTLENGFAAIREFKGGFGELTRRFADNIVLGARGNSGVILSQFFRGVSLSLSEAGRVDERAFVRALEEGVELSYRSVAEPVEGTMLTVMREATEHLSGAVGENAGLKELIAIFLDAARISLENTPNLLPVLKAAHVIDSGGAGVVYIFEGMYKYLNNERIEDAESAGEKPAAFTDYSRFDMTSRFPLGYCTETLLQLTDCAKPYDHGEFVERLGEFAESIVVSRQDDKVKVHAHSTEPERILALCHEYGEFLTLKIENMTVQHTETHKIVEAAPNRRAGGISVVAVANDSFMKEKYFEMGADVVVNAVSGYNPSAKDFMEAYAEAGSSAIIVFPNCKNSLFVAEQARELLDRNDITVIGSKNAAECYAALAIMDYEAESPREMAEEIRKTIAGIRTVTVSRAVSDALFDDTYIRYGDYIALSGSRLLAVGKSFTKVAGAAIDAVVKEKPCDVMTFFFGGGSNDADRGNIIDAVGEKYPMTDTDVLLTDTELYDLIISFE